MNGQYKNCEPDYINTPSFMGMILLLLVPLINFIPLSIWAFSRKSGPNKRSFARASLILQIPYIIMGTSYIFILFKGLMGT